MTLDEIEKLARQFEGRHSDTFSAFNSAVELSEALLAMLPVVRLAEKYGAIVHNECASKRDESIAHARLIDAIDSLRAHLDSGAGKGG